MRSSVRSEEAAQKQAMFELLIDQRQALLRNTGGVIPGQQSTAAKDEAQRFEDPSGSVAEGR